MAKKKMDFTAVNTNPVFSMISEATAEPEQEATEAAEEQEVQDIPKTRKERKTYTEQEAAAFLKSLNTTGRKGLKLPRINLAFSPQVYDYVTTMARVRGETITDFCNKIMTDHMKDHLDIYLKALEFRNSL